MHNLYNNRACSENVDRKEVYVNKKCCCYLSGGVLEVIHEKLYQLRSLKFYWCKML